MAHWKATTYAGASRVLNEWAKTAPKGGGYDKTRVTIVWENGFEHAYTHDLKHPSQGGVQPDVQADLNHTIEFLMGRAPNTKWTESQYQHVLRRYEDQIAQIKLIVQRCMTADI